MPRPLMIVVAGPPGSGKTAAFPTGSFGVDGFNIDDRCAQVVGSYRAISRTVRSAVAAECERFVHEHIESGRSFAVETTLRTTKPIEQAKEAADRDFATHLRFLATGSPEENIARVLQRAQSGGHAASEQDIRRIYDGSLRNLAHAIRVFETVRVYDSTVRWAPPRLVAIKRRGTVQLVGESPPWLARALSLNPR